MSTQEKHQLISISQLSQRTGVNSVTLRAWERRYGLLKPQRSPKGHRLYVHDDVEKVISILAWINKGVSVGKVKPLLINGSDKNTVDISDQWNDYQNSLLSAAVNFNESKIATLYQKLTKQYPMSACINYCFKPLFESQDNIPDVSSAQYFLSACLKSRMQHSFAILNKNLKKTPQQYILISHALASSWKIWVTALLLQEKNIKVYVFDEVADIAACVRLSSDMSVDCAIIYTELNADGINKDHIDQISGCDHIYVAGHKIWLAKGQGNLALDNVQILLNPFDICY